MNEEQLADALAEHLDALLGGKPLAELPPAEIAGLLTFGEELTMLAPKAPPEFGLTLKSSLLGSNGSAPAAGGFMLGGGLLALIAVIGLGIVAALLLVVGGPTWRAEEPSPSTRPSSTSVPVETEPEETSPALVTASPLPATVTAIPSLTQIPPVSPTVIITHTVTPAPPIPTPLVDVLPPITVTVRITVELPLPSSLVPGSGDSGGSGSNSGGSSGGGGGGSTGGDHDRGHGNDPDGHDEDNPGRGDDDD